MCFLNAGLLLFSHSVTSNSSVIPRTVAHQAPLSMGFSRQEYWSGLPFASPSDLPDPGIELASPALEGRFFITKPPGESQMLGYKESNRSHCRSLLRAFSMLMFIVTLREGHMTWVFPKVNWLWNPFCGDQGARFGNVGERSGNGRKGMDVVTQRLDLQDLWEDEWKRISRLPARDSGAADGGSDWGRGAL